MNPNSSSSGANGTDTNSPFGLSPDVLAALQGAQGMNGMLGQMGGQNPFSNPYFVAQLQSAAAGVSWPQAQMQMPSNHMPAINPWMPQASSAPNFPAYNLPNILSDAMRMNTPVGSSPNDEDILVRTLRDSLGKGQTYRQALDSLHGVNNHAAPVWKDHYLEHKPRIDKMVDEPVGNSVGAARQSSSTSSGDAPGLPKPFHTPALPRPRGPNFSKSKEAPTTKTAGPSKPVRSAKKPTFDSSPPPDTLHLRQRPRSSRSSPWHKNYPKPASTSSTSTTSTERATRSYSYTSTRFVSSSEGLPNLYPSYTELKVPEPPSRSPTPPANLIQDKRGYYQYSQEDKDYFIKKVSWEATRNPHCSKKEILEELARKASHHSESSWRSHWHSNPIADKILVTAQEGLSRDSEESNKSNDNESNDDGSRFDDAIDLGVDSDEDEKNMGEYGEPYTDADKRMLARYIASSDDWDDMTNVERSEQVEQRFPQRTSHAWRYYYSRHEQSLLRLASAYREHYAKRSKKLHQGASSSPTLINGSAETSKSSKRKILDRDEEEQLPKTLHKRLREYAEART